MNRFFRSAFFPLIVIVLLVWLASQTLIPKSSKSDKGITTYSQLENAISAHPDVLSCLVVGVPHEDLGQVPYALVHTADVSVLDAAGVQEFLRERIASYKVPDTVEFVSTPLRDDAGKARRSAVRTEVMARLQRQNGRQYAT